MCERMHICKIQAQDPYYGRSAAAAAATNLVANKPAILYQTALATLQTADTPNPLSPIL